MSEAERERVLAQSPLTRLTPFSIASVEALQAELDEIRRKGVAYSNQESVLGVGAVAAAVRNANGVAIAAIGLVYPFHLVQREQRKRFTRLTLEAATRVSERVGWHTLTFTYGRSKHV
jgi:DNA-binding IclR family transcriptional regulator